MKKAIYATIAIFVAILLWTIIVAQQRPVNEVKYEQGVVKPK